MNDGQCICVAMNELLPQLHIARKSRENETKWLEVPCEVTHVTVYASTFILR